MANAFRIANAMASAAAGDGSNYGLRGYIGSGAKIKCYTGGVNSTPATAPAGTLLSSNALSSTFGAASNGVITAPSIGNATAGNSGTAGCFWMTKSDDTTGCADGTVGQTSGYDLNFDNPVFVSGGTVAISGFAITVPPN